MIPIPNEPHAGDSVSATKMAELVRFVRATRPIPGPGIKSRVTPNGTILSCSTSARRLSGAHSPTPHEFEVRAFLEDPENLRWMIYLPCIDYCILYDKTYLSPSWSDIEHVDPTFEYGTKYRNWFFLNAPPNVSLKVWLNLYKERNRGDTYERARLTFSESGAAEFNIFVADAWCDRPAQGDPYEWEVRQNVVGMVYVCGQRCHCDSESSASVSGYDPPSSVRSGSAGSRWRFDL